MASVISVMAEIKANVSSFTAGMAQAEQAAKKVNTAATGNATAADNFEKSAGKMGKSASQLTTYLKAAAKAFILIQGVNFARQAVGLASAYEAEAEGVKQAFGEASTIVADFAKKAAMTAGVSEVAALRSAKSFGVYAKSAGLAGEEQAKFATSLVQTAGDLGSFFDLPTEQALFAIQSGLRGEAEPLRRFNILIDDAAMKAKAMEMGLGSNTNALSQQQKILIRQGIILDQVGVAQGDFVKYQDTYGNSIKSVSALMENLKADVGSALLPILAKLAGALMPIIEKMGPLLTKVFEALVPVIQVLVDSLDDILPILDPLISIFEMVAKTAAKVFSAVLPIAIKVIQKLMPFLMKFADVFLRLIEKLLPPFTKILEKVLLPLLEWLIDILSKYLIPYWELLLEAIGPVADFIADVLVSAFRQLQKILGPIWALLQPLIDGLFKLVGIDTTIRVDSVATSSGSSIRSIEGITGASKVATDAVTKTDESLKKTGATAKETAKKVKDAVDSMTKDFKGLLAAFMPQKIADELGKFEAAVVDASGELNERITQAYSEKTINKKQTQALRKFAKESIATLRSVAKERDKVMADLAKAYEMQKATAEFKKGMTELANSIKPLQRVEEAIGRFEQQVKDSFTNVQNKIDEGINIGLFSDSVAKGLKAAANTAKAQLTAIAKQRDELAKTYDVMVSKLQAASDFRNATRDAVMGVADLSKMGGDAKSMITNLTVTLDRMRKFRESLAALSAAGLNKTAFNAIVASGLETGLATAQAIAKGGDQAVADINGLYSAMNDVAFDIGDQTSTYMYDGGVSVIQGLIDGIVSQDEQLRLQAESIANNFNTAFQKTIDKVEIDLQALIDNLLSKQTELENTAITLAKAFSDQFQKGVTAFTSGKGYTFTPLATGVTSAKPVTTTTNNAINVTVNAGLGTNGTQVGKEIVNYIYAYQKSSGQALLQ